RAIAYHYDVSNEFYALFLDRRMVYTCAYYRRPDGDLDQAQEDKLDLVCRKLRLQPGERLLDIGCGWGSLVVWAAERYGVLARGVTLSRAQAEYGQAWIRRLGLEERARGDHLHYRHLPRAPRLHKLAAVGSSARASRSATWRACASTTRAPRGSGPSVCRRTRSARGRWRASASTAPGSAIWPRRRSPSRRARPASTRWSPRVPIRRCARRC